MIFGFWQWFGVISMMLVCGMTPVVVIILLLRAPYKSDFRKKVSWTPNFNQFWKKAP